MSNPQVIIGEDTPDVEMAAGEEVDITETLEVEPIDGEGEDAETSEDAEPRTSFTAYLASPIIQLAIGTAPDQTLLFAHQALLMQSPFFASAIEQFSADAATRRLEFAHEDVETMGSFLEYLYTGEYYPRKVGNVLEGGLADDKEVSTGDASQLLRHGKVYTLADKFGLQSLKALAHSKVHVIETSPAGELAYARFVYGSTPRDDVTIRRPIAAFWGQRSHVLRHQAEDQFKQLCLEYPEFAFDVLSYVLDVREKRSEKEDKKSTGVTPGSTRKRARMI